MWHALALVGAGFLAGGINAIVGSGSLITFPTLVGLGYTPFVANVTNTVGIVPGSISGAFGYRRELAGQRNRILRLGVYGVAGGLAGGFLLLELPGSFEAVVPYLVLLAVFLVIVQPRLAARLARRRAERAAAGAVGPGAPAPGGADPGSTAPGNTAPGNTAPGSTDGDSGGPVLRAGVFSTAVYGGYFGAAQGVILIALLGIGLDDDLQRANALKNVLAALVNGVAALLFMVHAPVSWAPAGILAVASTVGGQVGAGVGRRLPSPVLRAVIVVAGTAVAIKLLV